MTEQSIAERLAAPFPPDDIHWRIGPTNKNKSSGIALAYITARDAMNRLDEVVGIGGWSSSYEFNQRTCVCNLSLNIDGQWISKSDGAGATDIEGEKGQLSDALKRAAVSFGVARYLYEMPTIWVELEEERGRLKIKDKEIAGLDKALMKLTQGIQWGDRADQNAFRLVTTMAQEFEIEQLRALLNNNKGLIAQLPVGQKTELRELVERMKNAEMKLDEGELV